MPNIRRRAKRRNDYTMQEKSLLSSGVSLNTRFGCLHKGKADLDAMREAWNNLRDELLPEWIESHPFSRPVAYWLFDASLPRIAVVGEQLLEALEWSDAHRHYRQHFFFGLNRRLGIDDGSRDSQAAFESEQQYLIRCELLTAGERDLL